MIGVPKRVAFRSQKLRDSARDQDCTLRIPFVCNGRTDTTVLAHSNRLSDGKGRGQKADDNRACFSCHACHDVLDGRRPRPRGITYEMLMAEFDRAIDETHDNLRGRGLGALLER